MRSYREGEYPKSQLELALDRWFPRFVLVAALLICLMFASGVLRA